MALNGGVSLAVWMGGCAVELDRGRRATAAGGEPPRIYDALCECFGRQLVIDILTGASAGGINGALLGAAMVSGRKLDTDFVREQWLDLGDLGDLLYPATKDDPPALLNGDVFYERLLSAFKRVLDAGGESDPCATSQPIHKSVPSLDVTMTDVIGIEKRFRDAWGGELIAREHRPRFKFREAAHFSAKALAAAARTSASFPVAFEPWEVKGDPRVLAGLPQPTYGMDGGLLDNAPIEAALDLIPTKSSNSRVIRYVCYLNGDPVLPTDELAGAKPGLRAVGGYTINLPRVAPFVDQLYAIKRAVERPQFAESVQLELLTMDLDQLRGVAHALFETYCERRTMESLEELLGDPGEATAMKALLGGTSGRLPWIPFALPRASGSKPDDSWHWGIRPAQRILHLQLDLLRAEIPQTTGALRVALRGLRTTIDRELTALGEAREHVLTPQNENDPASFREEPPLDRLQKAVSRSTSQSSRAGKAVRIVADAFRELVTANPGHFLAESAESEGGPLWVLFGETAPAGEDWFSRFLLRVLAVEVIRRAFSTEAEIESAEELRFVQLTPASPSPIFTSGPLGLASPASAKEKLAGVGLGHFAGFYRRSWRANDFMWGRLDAAARIVDLLLDKPSEEIGIGSQEATPEGAAQARSKHLADALLPSDPADSGPTAAARRWLVKEALDDAAATKGAPPASATTLDELRDLTREKIYSELITAGTGVGVDKMPFCRAVFQRAAQLEIVVDELPVIRDEAANDSKLGSAVQPFPKPGKSSECDEQRVIDEITSVRALYEEGKTLPGRLTDSEEVVSDLGLRTITHATFVALAAVRTAGAPMSKFFGIVRTPLSAVAATVAESRIHRAAAGLGFWAAAIYLTSRLVTTTASEPLSFSAVWSWATLTALIATLGLVGFAAVPILRLWRGVHRWRNFLTALGLLGSAVGVAVALAAIFGSFDIERIIFTPGATLPPTLVVLAPLATLGAISFARLPFPGWLGSVAGLLERFRGSRFSLGLVVTSFALLGVWSAVDLCKAGFDGGEFWHPLSAVLALLVTPIVAGLSLTRWKHRPEKASETDRKCA